MLLYESGHKGSVVRVLSVSKIHNLDAAGQDWKIQLLYLEERARLLFENVNDVI